MEVRIIFKDATAEKIYQNVDNIYTKGEMLVIRQGDWLWKYPLQNIFSVCHKHGNHWGSKTHKQAEKLED
jgi:hypothetical protein